MYVFDSKIRYSEIDADGKLSMAALINYFQDCSTFQSEELGVGIQYLGERHLAWVLVSWQIEVERYPRLCERVTVGTKPYEMKAFLGNRNFLMMDSQGRLLAKANSVWTLLDMETGRPYRVPAEISEKYPLEEPLEMKPLGRKIQMPSGGDFLTPVTVGREHLDTNHHVNNQQYLAIAMRYLPEKFTIGSLRAEYKKQAHLGDQLVPYVVSDGGKVMVALQDEAGAAYMAAEFERMEE